MGTEIPEWLKMYFDTQTLKQITWAKMYNTPEFRHGDVGHADKVIIATLVDLANYYRVQCHKLAHEQGLPSDYPATIASPKKEP